MECCFCRYQSTKSPISRRCTCVQLAGIVFLWILQAYGTSNRVLLCVDHAIIILNRTLCNHLKPQQQKPSVWLLRNTFLKVQIKTGSGCIMTTVLNNAIDSCPILSSTTSYRGVLISRLPVLPKKTYGMYI